MLDNKSSRSKIILKNTLSLYLRMFIALLIGLYTSRVLLKALGEVDFGVFNLVGGLIIVFSFINLALSAATQRFITFDLGIGDIKKLQKTFAMNLNIYFVFSIVIIIFLETIGLYFLNNKLSIEAARLPAANWIFHFMVISVLFTMIRIPYHALITAYENMSFIAAVGIIESVSKLLIAVLITLSSHDRLILYGGLYSAINISLFFFYKIYSNQKFPETSVYSPVWDKSLFLSSLKFSGLSLYEQLAVMMTFQGVDLILNMFFGVIVNAAMGITKQVQAGVFNFIASFQSAMSPQITKSYSINDFAYLTRLMVIAPKYSLYLVLMITVPIYFNLEPLLNFWLSTVPMYTVGFCKLILISCVFESVSLPLRILIFAQGNITKYQIIVGTTLLLNPILTYVFLKHGFGPNIVLWIRIFLFIIVDTIRIMFIKRLISLTLANYIYKTFGPVVIILVPGVGLTLLFHLYSNLSTFINLGVSGLIMAFFILMFGLSKHEREFLNSHFKQIVCKAC